eukprot:129341-Rhodomonas_salina.1
MIGMQFLLVGIPTRINYGCNRIGYPGTRVQVYNWALILKVTSTTPTHTIRDRDQRARIVSASV